jgi:glutamate-1-semialdehyde aminotransferase
MTSSQYETAFVSAAYTERDIEKTLHDAKIALKQIS